MGQDKGFPTMDEVRERVKKLREIGELAGAVRSSGINYGLDEEGRLVAEYPDGRREIGSFINGKFVPDRSDEKSND